MPGISAPNHAPTNLVNKKTNTSGKRNSGILQVLWIVEESIWLESKQQGCSWCENLNCHLHLSKILMSRSRMVCGVCLWVSTITEGECKFLTLHVGHRLQFICTVVYTGLFFKTSNCNVMEHTTCFCIAVVVQTCPTFIFSVSIFLWLLL